MKYISNVKFLDDSQKKLHVTFGTPAGTLLGHEEPSFSAGAEPPWGQAAAYRTTPRVLRGGGAPARGEAAEYPTIPAVVRGPVDSWSDDNPLG